MGLPSLESSLGSQLLVLHWRYSRWQVGTAGSLPQQCSGKREAPLLCFLRGNRSSGSCTRLVCPCCRRQGAEPTDAWPPGSQPCAVEESGCIPAPLQATVLYHSSFALPAAASRTGATVRVISTDQVLQVGPVVTEG